MDTATDLSIFVTIHDQNLLLAYEADKKFEAVGANLTYVFVGNGDVSKLKDNRNVVVARTLGHNIEDHKYLVDFTAWYALVLNNIPTTDYVSLIQYDVSISSNFSQLSGSLLREHPAAVLGYVPLEMKNRNFIRQNMGYAPLKKACREVYGIDIDPILKSHVNWAVDKLWPTTNNVAMHYDTLKDFVRWFTPLALFMGNEKPVGHAFERAIKLFCILAGRRNIYAPSLLSHYQLNSHETQDFQKDNVKLHKLLSRNIMSKK